MMIDITSQEVKKLAKLSALDIQDDEIQAFKQRIQTVLQYAQKVAQAPDYPEDVLHKNSNIFVPDEPVTTDSKPLLELAPEAQEEYYVVPAIIEKK